MISMPLLDKLTASLLCLLMFGADLADARPLKRDTNEKVFVLHQRHRWLGKVLVYCNESHVRVTSVEGEAVLVANAPDWRVQIYDPKRKLIYEVSKQKFFESGYTGPFQEGGLTKSRLRPRRSSGFLGTIPGTCYTFSNRTKSTYWTLKSNVIGPVCQVLQAFFEAPAAPGIPLAIESKDPQKRSGDQMLVFAEGGGSELSTAKCEPGTIDLSAFNYVKGYKKARFATDVLVNAKIKNEMETGLTEFGLGLGKTK